MRKILLATAAAAFALSGVTMAAPASAEPSKPAPGTASPMHASCGRAGPNLENRVDADAPAGGSARQRSGSSTSCEAPGQLEPTDDALYFCYTVGNDGYTWTYLRNQSKPSHVRGWVRDDLLDLNPDGTRGSVEWCGF